MARPKKGGGRVTPRGTRPGNRAGAPVLDRPAPRAAQHAAGGHGHARSRITPWPNPRPVRPGVVGLSRSVPPEIPRPPYAATGWPAPIPGESNVRDADTIARMRRAGAAAAEVLLEVGAAIRPGVTHDDLDAVGHEAIVRRGAYPSPLNYKQFPKSLCTSANEIICHGIPDSRKLEPGDILNIDVTVYLDGVHGDTNATFFVGEVDEDSQRLVRETRTCLYKGIEAVRPGRPVNVIGRAIEEHASAHGLGVVREFIGHGIGESFHTSFQIPHYYEPRATTVIEEGMTFTIEPMIVLGDPALYVWDDAWTAATLDGSRCAQFEHTLVVRADGAEILTVTDDGRCAHDLVGEIPTPA